MPKPAKPSLSKWGRGPQACSLCSTITLKPDLCRVGIFNFRAYLLQALYKIWLVLMEISESFTRITNIRHCCCCIVTWLSLFQTRKFSLWIFTFLGLLFFPLFKLPVQFSHYLMKCKLSIIILTVFCMYIIKDAGIAHLGAQRKTSFNFY